MGVGPQRPDEWAQDGVYVVFEEEALTLDGGGRGAVTDTTQTRHPDKWYGPQIWQTSTLPTAPPRLLPVPRSPQVCVPGPSASQHGVE